ncbi:hypothetical protein FDP41_004740 [Naegleria fowleri]|uniref:Macro domain-containing protein n=1 Tax=Naegleria fowleri TaxID=5763 RepID=A0A6A5BPP0_NAEFO|nr:uncharacterized protein FDP41_004740 [Naegleria fowleri]KAF0976064.1 hypothetical protein FDP41_004740 [Naegleria fowleri]CAG4714332.1 unnamed protein product [Naegleria fowleri]
MLQPHRKGTLLRKFSSSLGKQVLLGINGLLKQQQRRNVLLLNGITQQASFHRILRNNNSSTTHHDGPFNLKEETNHAIQRVLRSSVFSGFNAIERNFHYSVGKQDSRFTLTNYSDNDPDFEKPTFSGKVSKNYVPFHARPGGIPPELLAARKHQKEENPTGIMAKTVGLTVLVVFILYQIASIQFVQTTMKEEVLRKTAVVFRRRIMELQVTKGAIENQAVDAIIIPSDDKLSNNQGVSERVANVAGRNYSVECATVLQKNQGSLKPEQALATSNGGVDATLMCKNVIHVLPPTWSGGRKKEALQLERTILAALAKADEVEAKTVSMYMLNDSNFPKRRAAEITIDAVLKYAYERDVGQNTPSTLQIVKFVNDDEEFNEQLLAVWDKKKTKGQLV